MVSIIIVSHSQRLAEGVVELAAQMTHGKIDIVAAAGIDDDDNPIGTDATKIMMALEEVNADAGILILVDMGSALLSTDMALELIDPDLASKVVVCPAPLIEGGVAAAVAAAAGLPIETVIEEAKGALAAKYEQLGEVLPHAAPVQAAVAPMAESAQSMTWTVLNPHGIHARPASTIVTTLTAYDCDMWIAKADKQANARSINSIALLGIRKDDSITFMANGPDASAAIEAFTTLAQSHFGESLDTAPAATPPEAPQPAPTNAGQLSGIAASEGIAIAPVWIYKSTMPAPRQHTSKGHDAEWQHYEKAMHAAVDDLKQLQIKAAASASASEAEIFAAHQQIIADPDLHQQLNAGLASNEQNIEQVWAEVITHMAEAYANADDPYLQARKNDMLDVGQRIMQQLQGKTEQSLNLSSPVVLVAHELTPSDTAKLDPKQVKGICMEAGGHTSHSAILARALGIPAIVGCSGALTHCQDGELVILDGHQGILHLHPSTSEVAEASLQVSIADQQRKEAEQHAHAPALTQDRHAISVVGNVATLNDAIQAAQSGAEGIGLLRSEFLYMDRTDAPTEQEQIAFYCAVCEQFPEEKVVVRTLDIGGDKPLAYLQQRSEDNPFLGCRGLRLCLQQPEIFKTQLRALLQTRALHPNLAVMFPMVSVTEELIQAKALMAQVHDELCAEGAASSIPSTGIMIEVPSAVVCADKLAMHADFFSIGSNDLTQYVMAADRGNDSVSTLSAAHQPAVLKMIQTTVEAAHQQEITVSVCGEMAGDPQLAPVLIGLGVDTLSMSASRIANVKQAIRTSHSQTAQAHANKLLACATLAEVEAQLY